MWTTGRVVERIGWNDKLFTLKIDAQIAPFIPGQFIKLSQIRDGKRVARAYSLVNSPDCDYLEVLAVAVDDGQLSPDLHALKLGDEIEVSTKAAGFMVLDEVPVVTDRPQDIWFLATGTAVGPFISMMRDRALWQRFEHIVLVYGVRYQADLAYLEELQEFVQSNGAQFKLVLSITRESHELGLDCRIPEGIRSGEIEAQAGVEISPQASQVMICGNPDMVEEAKIALQDRDLVKNLRRAPGQITVEKYW